MGNNKKFKFGDFVIIEQKRYSVKNEFYLYKVIGQNGKSNCWVDVPVQCPEKETGHKYIEEVIKCVCCSLDEREILKYRVSDVRKNDRFCEEKER